VQSLEIHLDAYGVNQDLGHECPRFVDLPFAKN
jgi:hypothetical protein